MPSQQEHLAIARRLARLLGLDEEKTRIGALLPDLDYYKPLQHRKTLHNPIPLPLLFRVDRSVALGYLSHIIADDLPLPMKLYHILLRRLEK